MANRTKSASRISEQARRQAHRVSGRWVEGFARAGYIAKGVIYAVVGLLSVQAAMGAGEEVGDSQSVIQEIASKPFGKGMLMLLTAGLVGLVLWRFVQAFLDAEENGTDAKGVVKRVGFAVSGLFYGLLAFLAGRVAFGAGGGGGGSRETWLAQLMDRPFGRWGFALAGAVVIGIGLHLLYKAYTASFMDEYRQDAMSERERRASRFVGRFGLASRGLTFGLIGAFFVQAGLHANAGEAGGQRAAFQTLARQPYGPWLLLVVAAGFVAYGLYCFSRARYRHFETP